MQHLVVLGVSMALRCPRGFWNGYKMCTRRKAQLAAASMAQYSMHIVVMADRQRFCKNT